MDKLQNNRAELLMLGGFFEYLKNVLMAGLIYHFSLLKPGGSILAFEKILAR
ncbi:MAG: hypothetical protein WAW41_06075 [Methylobacter sp.]